jgi:hypothetical protein
MIMSFYINFQYLVSNDDQENNQKDVSLFQIKKL